MLGRTIGGRYLLLDPIGTGSFGQVYRARDLASGIIVAVKHFIARDGGRHDIFWRETSLQLRLRHPNIVRLLGLVHQENGHEGFSVSEYVPGGNLRGFLMHCGPLPPAVAARMLFPVADALKYAHRQRIIHRDIKPENLLCGSGVANAAMPDLKVADFGLARHLAPDQVATTHQGTPAYMAPEQFYGEYTHQTDIYALGVILHELIAGSLPFTGGVRTLMKAHLNEPLPQIPGVSSAVADALGRFTAKDLTSRLATMAEAQDCLAEIIRIGDESRSVRPGLSLGEGQRRVASDGRDWIPELAMEWPRGDIAEVPSTDSNTSSVRGVPDRLVSIGGWWAASSAGRWSFLDPQARPSAPPAIWSEGWIEWDAAPGSNSAMLVRIGEIVRASPDVGSPPDRWQLPEALRAALPCPVRAASSGKAMLFLSDRAHLLALGASGNVEHADISFGFGEAATLSAASGSGEFWIAGRTFPRRLRLVRWTPSAGLQTGWVLLAAPAVALTSDPEGEVWVLTWHAPTGEATLLALRGDCTARPLLAWKWGGAQAPRWLSVGATWCAIGSSDHLLLVARPTWRARSFRYPASHKILGLAVGGRGNLGLLSGDEQSLRLEVIEHPESRI